MGAVAATGRTFWASSTQSGRFPLDEHHNCAPRSAAALADSCLHSGCVFMSELQSILLCSVHIFCMMIIELSDSIIDCCFLT